MIFKGVDVLVLSGIGVWVVFVGVKDVVLGASFHALENLTW